MYIGFGLIESTKFKIFSNLLRSWNFNVNFCVIGRKFIELFKPVHLQIDQMCFPKKYCPEVTDKRVFFSFKLKMLFVIAGIFR